MRDFRHQFITECFASDHEKIAHYFWEGAPLLFVNWDMQQNSGTLLFFVPEQPHGDRHTTKPISWSGQFSRWFFLKFGAARW